VDVPVNLLEQVELAIDYVDTNGISSKTTVPDFKIHDVDWSEFTFQVPENLASLTVTLSAKIKVICSGEHQDLTSTKAFTFERHVDTHVLILIFTQEYMAYGHSVKGD
jgi:hypothetical protein